MRKILLGAFAVVMGASLSASPASAQDFFDFLFGNPYSSPSYSKKTYYSKPSGFSKGSYRVRFSKKYRKGEVIVSFGDRRLYFIEKRGRAISYPIAVPKEDARWSGVNRISQKRVNPSWTPTAEMRKENPNLPEFVPGGHPRNPLGSRALYIGSSLYRIHGTDAPWTIGKAVSKGCIRMYDSHVEALYPRVRVGAKVTVTWRRFHG